MLAFGIKSLSLSDVTRIWPRYDLQEAARLPRALYEASMLALKIGRYDAQPQVRHIQVRPASIFLPRPSNTYFLPPLL